MKKLVVLMLAGMMSAAMVTGCGSSSADTAAPAESEETDAAADEAEAADTALRLRWEILFRSFQ